LDRGATSLKGRSRKRCLVKRAAYTAAGHVNTICGVWLFTHYALTLEIMTAGYTSILQPPTLGANVENPIRLLRSLFDTDIGPRLRSLTIRLNRCILLCGLPIDQYGNSLWKGVSSDMRFSATNPVHVSRSHVGEDAVSCAALKTSGSTSERCRCRGNLR